MALFKRRMLPIGDRWLVCAWVARCRTTNRCRTSWQFGCEPGRKANPISSSRSPKDDSISTCSPAQPNQASRPPIPGSIARSGLASVATAHERGCCLGDRLRHVLTKGPEWREAGGSTPHPDNLTVIARTALTCWLSTFKGYVSPAELRRGWHTSTLV